MGSKFRSEFGPGKRALMAVDKHNVKLYLLLVGGCGRLEARLGHRHLHSRPRPHAATNQPSGSRRRDRHRR